MEKARTIGAIAKKNQSHSGFLYKEMIKTSYFSEKMPSLETFRDGIKKNLNISEADMSKTGVSVYINLGWCLRIGAAEGVAGGKGSLDIGFNPALAGDRTCISPKLL